MHTMKSTVMAGLVAILVLPALAKAESYEFSTIAQAPMDVTTSAYDVNSSGAVVGQSGMSGFLWSAGTYSVTSVPSWHRTTTTGINDAGQIVGFYTDENSYNGFLTSMPNFGVNGLTPINVPGNGRTIPAGINNTGEIVGYYNNYSAYSNGFLRTTDGSYVTLSYPGAVQTRAREINDSNQVVGDWENNSGVFHGWLWNAAKGYQSLDVVGATDTEIMGVNNAGQIAGLWTDAGGLTHGFVWDNYGSGNFTSLDFPGASYTQILGISNRGEIAGSYFLSDGIEHEFMAIPVPEPATMALLTLGVVGTLRRKGARR